MSFVSPSSRHSLQFTGIKIGFVRHCNYYSAVVVEFHGFSSPLLFRFPFLLRMSLWSVSVVISNYRVASRVNISTVSPSCPVNRSELNGAVDPRSLEQPRLFLLPPVACNNAEGRVRYSNYTLMGCCTYSLFSLPVQVLFDPVVGCLVFLLYSSSGINDATATSLSPQFIPLLGIREARKWKWK